jgi:hypothetical protein
VVSRHSFKIHKGGKSEPEDETSSSAKCVGKDGKTRRVLVKGPVCEVWCDVTLDHDGPLPSIVSDAGVWIKIKDDEFMITRNKRVGAGAHGYDRGPGDVTRQAEELQATASGVGQLVDCLTFVKSYLRFLYEEIKLGNAENWK